MSLDDQKNITDEKNTQAQTQQIINADKEKGIDLDKVAVDLAARLTGESRSYTTELKEILGIKSKLNEDEKALLSISNKLTSSAQENNTLLRRSGELNTRIFKDRKNLLEVGREINVLLATNREMSGQIYNEAVELQRVQKKVYDLDQEIALIHLKKGKTYKEELETRHTLLASLEAELKGLHKNSSIEAKKLAVLLATQRTSQEIIKVREQELKFGHEVNKNLGITGALLDNLDKIGVRILGGIGLNFGVFAEAIKDGKDKMHEVAEAYTLLNVKQKELSEAQRLPDTEGKTEKLKELSSQLSSIGLQISQTLDIPIQAIYKKLNLDRVSAQEKFNTKLQEQTEKQKQERVELEKQSTIYKQILQLQERISKESQKPKKEIDKGLLTELTSNINKLKADTSTTSIEVFNKDGLDEIENKIQNLKVISKDIKFQNLEKDLEKANKKLNSFGTEIAKANTGLRGMTIKFRAMRQALPGIRKAFTEALFDPLTPALIGLKLAGSLINLMKENFLSLDKATVEYRRLTGENASVLAGMNDRLATSVQIMTIQAALTKEIGSSASAIFGPEELGALAEAQNLLGLTAEQTSFLGIMSKSTGKTIDGFQDSFSAAAAQANALGNSAIPAGVVFGDILNLSKDIFLSLGNNPDALYKAGVAARALGLDLKKVDQIASSLLDFESSIEAELEAQLLTGKAINLAKAREFALNNDLAGVANELTKNGASAAEFARMNRLQQESIAKALGMSREELAKSIIAQDLQNDLTAEQRAEIRGVTLEQSKQMEVQEEIRMSLQKLAQAFLPIIQAITPILTAFTPLISILSKAITSVLSLSDFFTDAKDKATILSQAIKAALGLLIAWSLTKAGIWLYSFMRAKSNMAQMAILAGQISKSLSSAAISSLAIRPMPSGLATTAAVSTGATALGTGVAGGAVAGGLAKTIGKTALKAIPFVGIAFLIYELIKAFSSMPSVQDAIINSQGGLVVSGPKGSIQLDKEDSILAGTDLPGDIKSTQTTTKTFPTPPAVDFKLFETAQTLGTKTTPDPINPPTDPRLFQDTNTLLKELISVVKKGGNVYMDSNKVGQAIVLSNSKGS